MAELLGKRKKVKDVSVVVRGVKRYWRFLEDNNLSWDNFPQQKSIKPTYLYRNLNLLKAEKSNEIKFSTASLYMNQVIQFYAWAIHNRILTINEDNAPFESEIEEKALNWKERHKWICDTVLSLQSNGGLTHSTYSHFITQIRAAEEVMSFFKISFERLEIVI